LTDFIRRIFSTHSLQRPAFLLLAAIALLAVTLAACGDDDEADGDGNGDGGSATATPDGIDYGSLGGEIRIDGSSTVFPISEAVAEEFSKVADTRVNVAFSGTGGGFEKFCRGEIEISDASRPMKQEEKDTCAGEGITDIVELQVGIDALTIVLNPNNDWVDCLTTQQLFDIFKTDGADKWSDVDPTWPDDDIVLYYPGTDSGTFDYFVESIITKTDENAAHRGDGTSSEDDNVLTQGVEGDKGAIGYFGFAYYEEAGSNLKAASVDGGDGCVEPTFDNALSGDYAPLSRPLFIYTREQFLTEKPEVVGFLKFYLDNAESLVAEVGYINIPEDLLADQQAKIEPFLP
jgi:phosphate transport system substrate-binding protein